MNVGATTTPATIQGLIAGRLMEVAGLSVIVRMMCLSGMIEE
jgi:hypothetical protein